MDQEDIYRIKHLITFKNDRILQLAIQKLFENMGAAVNRISDETKDIQGEIPWNEIQGMGYRLFLGYDEVDTNIVYETAINELPSIIEALKQLQLE
jgi:uncharacterized protein with HEPN domain